MEPTKTTAVTSTTQQDALQKAKSSAEKKFELIVSETAQVVQQCKAIVISDSTTFSMANQILSKANSALKDAEEKRKSINRPYQDQIEFVNSLVKEKITNPLTEAVKHGKELLRSWNESELKKASELKSEDSRRYTFLKTCEANIQKQVELMDTPEKCDKLITTINAQWPLDEKFGNYLAEANATKNNFISLLTIKKEALNGALSNDLSSVTESIAKVNEVSANQLELGLAAIEKKEIIQDSIHAEIGAVRRSWKWEVVDESKLPREFLSVDKKKVDEYMKANKDKFETAGTTKGGIMFYQDATPIIK